MSKVLTMMQYQKPVSQQYIDWHEAWVIMQCKDLLTESSHKPPYEVLTEDVVEQLHTDADKLEKSDAIGNAVQQLLNNQIISLFSKLEKLFPTTQTEDVDIGMPQYAKRVPIETKTLNTLYDLLGFEMEIRQSNLPGAGQGLFLAKGQILPGTGKLESNKLYSYPIFWIAVDNHCIILLNSNCNLPRLGTFVGIFCQASLPIRSSAR